jgi:methylglutaconyl-CoA hydratase
MSQDGQPRPLGPLVKVNVHGAAGTIILNRPEKRNALSRAILTDLTQAFNDLHQERRVRAVILTATGSTFCAGMDLAEMAATAKSENAHAQWHEDAVLYRDLIDTMLHFPKPIIAAVAGPALAGGAGLVLASDIVVASPAASFGLPEPKRGLVAGIVAPLLAFRVGGGRAGYLLLTAETIGAEEAFRYGLVHEIVPDDKVWARGVEIANGCAAAAPEAVQLTKRILNETIGELLGTQLSTGAAASATARTTEAAAEGLAAFLEKRPPEWK